MAVGEALRSLTTQRWRLSYELRETLDEDGRPAPEDSSEEDWLRRFIEEFDAEEVVPEPAERDLPAAGAGAPVQDLERDIEAVTSNEKGA